MKCTLCSTAYRSTGFVIALLITIFASPQRSWAQPSISTFTATPTGSAWLTAGNWTPSGVPTASTVAQFNSATAPGGTGQVGINMNGSTNNGAGSQLVGAINMISGRTISLTVGNSTTALDGTLILAGVTLTSTSNVILANTSSSTTSFLNLTNIVQSGTKLMNIDIQSAGATKNIITGSGTTLAVGNTISIGSNMIGSNNLTLLGGGTITLSTAGNGVNGGVLVLTGNNTSLTGAITIGSASSTYNSGILHLNSANALAGTTSLTINPFSQLYLASSTTYVMGSGATITLNGAGNNITTTYGAGAIKNGVAATLPASLAIATASTINAGNSLTLTGAVTYSSNLTKTGTGLLSFAGSNSGSGGFTISQGAATVLAASTNALGGGVVTFNPAVSTGCSITVNANQTIGGLCTVWPSASITGTQAFNIASGTTVTINQSVDTTFGVNPNAATGTATLSGAGNIVKTAAGALRLTGTTLNHTGAITISGGSMVVTSSATATLGAAGVVLSSGTLTLTPSATLSLGITGGFTINGGAASIANTTAGTTLIGATNISSGSIVSSNASTLTIAGITQSGGAITMSSAASVGTGALTLSAGTARFAPTVGTTTFGTVNVSGTAALTAANTTTLNGGAITQTGGAVTLSGSAATSLGASTISGGNFSVLTSAGTTTLGAMAVSSSAIVALSNASTLTVGAITQTGGTITISNSAVANTAALTLTGGTMVRNGSANSTTSAAVVINGGALTLSNTAGVITLTSGVTITTGSLTVAPSGSGLNVNTGALNINGGSFLLAPSAGTTLTMGAVRLGGGTFSTAGISAANIVVNGGVLTLATSSTITLGSGVSYDLKFATTSGAWAGTTLTIYGWQGDYVGGSGSKGRISFGTTATGLLAANLSKITFVDGSGVSYPAVQLSTGEVVPKATITTGTVTYTPPMYSDVTNAISVAYTYTGPVPTAVNVELSDNTGSFASPSVIGTGASSPVAATIPSAIAVGAYKVRVVETAPLAVTGSASTSFNIIGHPPIISSVSSYTAAVGSTITITGTNFNTTASNTKVFFGPIGVTPSSATFTTLTAVVPAGAAADFITVTDNTTKLSANSTIKFYPSYTNDYFTTTLTMQGPTSYSISYAGANEKWPWNTATGDLDGDGKQDLVVTTGYFDGSNSYSYISIFKNNTTSGSTDISTSSFSHVVTKQIQGLSSSVKIADLDGDGKPDIAAAGGSGSTVVNLLRNTTTGYGSGGTISVQASAAQISFGVIGPRVINIADFDQDGKLDIAAACFGTSAILPPAYEYDTLVILTNATSVGSDFNSSSFTYSKFGAIANESGGTTGGTSLATADFDSDGDIDVALIDQRAFGHTSKVTLFSNTSTAGSAQFTRMDTLDAGSVTQDIVAADFNMDGKPDFAVANQYGGDIVAYQNAGSFSFPTTYTLPGTTGWAPASLTSADMNGDGKPDIITVNANSLASVSDTVAVFLNTSTPGGSISFANPSVFHNGSNFSSAGVIVADLDQDKYPDIIVANLLSDQISILRNKPHVNMGAITGTTTVCHGSTTTLGYTSAGTTSPSGVTPAYSSSPLPSDLVYSWVSTDETRGTINPVTGAFNATGSGAVSAQYIITVLGTNIADTLTQPVNITYVNVTPGLDPNACQGDTVTLLPYSGETGSPVTYSLTFDGSGLGEGFTNVTNSALAGGTISITVPVAAAFNTYPASLTVSDGTCVSDPIGINVNLNEKPTGTVIASADSLCINRDALITFTTTAFSTITYKIDAGSTTTLVADGSGIATLSVPHLDATHDYILVAADNGFCTAAFADTAHIKGISETWTGITSTDWNTAANWGCALVPTDSDYVIVPVTPNQPDVAAAATATSLNLTIASGAAITLNANAVLSVKGDMANSGNVRGAGKVSLNGTSAQQISGIGTVKNIELNNTAGATINTGSRLVVGSTLTVTAGTLTTNDSLELYSDISGTARVAEIPASGAAISGNVKVDQYIQAGYRRYRFWAHPFSSAISLGQLQPYMDITGAGGSTNGFTTTVTNAPSAFKLVVAYSNPGASYDPGWVPITQINGAENDSNKLHQYQGLRLFMRGAKGQGLGGFPYAPSANTLAMKGALNQGTQIIPLVKGTSIQDYNFIGNPYASPVDIGTALKLAADTGYLVGTAFYVWNASLGAGGQYQAIDFVSGGVAQPYGLPAYASFQVRTAYNGAHICVTESMKTATATSYLFKAPATPYVSLHIYDESYHPWDMLDIRFNENATDAEDTKYDAVKPAGGDLSLYSLSADGRRMVIDARPYQAGKVVPLGITSTYKQNFIIRAENIAAPENGTVVLHDKLLNKYVELSAGTEYKFAINEDKATQGDNRFELSLKPAAVAAKFNVTLTPNPSTDDVKVAFSAPEANNVSVKVTDISGICVYSRDLGVQQAGQVTIPVAKLAAGIYMVELTSGNNRSVQKLVKE